MNEASKQLGSMILLNLSGDVTITWTDQYEQDMRGLVNHPSLKRRVFRQL